jgi:Zn-dependent peptidase ImmA (M78 family)
MPRRHPHESGLFDESGHSTRGTTDTGDRAIATEVNPDVLRWARETAGVEPASLARRFPKLDAWERGATKPTVSQLETLSDLYKRPLATFFLSSPPKEPPPPRDFRLLDREQPRTLSKKTRLAMRAARRAQRIYTTLSRDMQIGTSPVPQLRLAADVEQQAKTIRRLLRITVDEQRSWADEYAAWRHWRAAVEALGVLVLQQTMPVKEVRGFSLNGASTPTIVVSSTDAVVARLFTLFHELAHLLLDSVGMCLPNPDDDSPGKGVEPFCNRFSGAVLVPFELLRDDPALVSLGDSIEDAEVERHILRTAKSYKVSRFVLLFRLLAARSITSARVSRLMDQWSHEPPRVGKGGPQPPANKALNQYGARFVSAVLEAQTRSLITASDAAGYLALKVKHFPTLERLIATSGRG